MSERLLAMKAVLKETGSIYLHCDPYASHYLKAVLDVIFERKNFLNEIIWSYRTGGIGKRWFARKHDTLLFYSQGNGYTFFLPREESRDLSRFNMSDSQGRRYYIKAGNTYYADEGVAVTDVWDIPPVRNVSKERLGYPTQKPLALLERIIKASSNKGDIILDPFCGCGTTVHAAEELNRQWIGIDISRFAVELMNERVMSNFPHRLSRGAIETIGLPEGVKDARTLAQQDRFLFQRWACGRIGCHGLGERRGRPGPDGGIDGIIELAVIRDGKVMKETAIVEVKSGNVAPKDVRALSEIVRRSGSVAGIMLCFADQMGTVENQRSHETWSDASGTYPVIQGFSVEDLLAGKGPMLPPRYGMRRGGRISAS